MTAQNGMTAAQAGLKSDDQIRIALGAIAANGGAADMPLIYEAVEKHMMGQVLSEQGRASLRTTINRTATQAGYVQPHDPLNPGWRITPEGREFIANTQAQVEQVFNLDTQTAETHTTNTARGAAFELYILRLLRSLYPHYVWYHQGQHKSQERGLDLIGSHVGERDTDSQAIGVQIKFHAPNSAPTTIEWLKFLAGCFARRLDLAIFVTSGRLTSEQRREAGEARVVVIEGQDEITRIASVHGLEGFELFENEA